MSKSGPFDLTTKNSASNFIARQQILILTRNPNSS